MNLRKTSFQIIERELKPYLIEAIKFHPKIVDIKVVRGNPVTVHDYARRILIKARKEGIGSYSAEHIQGLQPRLRIYYSSGGISITAAKQKRSISKKWDQYQPPFDVLPDEAARWPIVVKNPWSEQIVSLVQMMESKTLNTPLEIHSNINLATWQQVLKDAGLDGYHLFKSGRNIMVWGKLKYRLKDYMGEVAFLKVPPIDQMNRIKMR